MNLKIILGQNIVAYRKKCGMTQQVLAHLADISISHLRNIEHGSGNTTVDMLERIARSLEVHPSDLLK